MPLYINPWALLQSGETLAGQMDLSAMTNLCNLQQRHHGNVDVRMSVIKHEDNQVVLQGEATAELELTCQRCLAPLIDTFSTVFELALVKYDSQLANVSPRYDAVVAEERLELLPIAEQELILTLPMIAKHENCSSGYQKDAREVRPDTQSPFANLADLIG